MRVLAKKLMVGLADTKAGRGLLLSGSGQRVPVFMLHRFRYGATRPTGHDPEMLAAALDYLKRHDFRILSVDEIVNGLAAGALPDRVVGFTMDDGYEDQGMIGAEVFLAHGCPATIYLVTGMIDGLYWPWEARVSYLFSHTEKPFTFEHAGAEYLSSGIDDEHSTNNRRALVRAMKRLPLSFAESEVRRLAEVVGINLPKQPPDDFRPLTWEQVASLERRGISFGAHTVSHPTLAAEDDRVAKQEIETSTARIRDKLARPSSVFCYPTGRYADFGSREIALVKAAGYSAALSSEPGYCTFDGTPDGGFELHRFGFPDNLEDFRAIVLQLLRFRRWNRRDGRA